MRKGQSTIEFLGTTLLFIIVLGLVLSLGTGLMSDFFSDADETQKNMEVERITTEMLTSPGYTEGGVSQWQPAAENMNSFGLADDPFMLNREKIESLADPNQEGLNYTQFLELTEAQNQYDFTFTWFPIIQTTDYYTKESPPDISGFDEPEDANYASADDRVYYGSTRINGAQINVLVTATDGVYDTAYIGQDTWAFGTVNYEEGDTYTIDNEDFEVYHFQNRENTPGTTLMFRKDLNNFGAPTQESGNVDRYERFGVLDDTGSDEHPVRVEALVW